jgi:hypothetical protein
VGATIQLLWDVPPIFFQAEVMPSSTFESPIDLLTGTIFTYSEQALHMPAHRQQLLACRRAVRRPDPATTPPESALPINSLLVHHYDGLVECDRC